MTATKNAPNQPRNRPLDRHQEPMRYPPFNYNFWRQFFHAKLKRLSRGANLFYGAAVFTQNAVMSPEADCRDMLPDVWLFFHLRLDEEKEEIRQLRKKVTVCRANVEFSCFYFTDIFLSRHIAFVNCTFSSHA